MVRNTPIPFHLESTPLQVKTDSTTGSGEQISMYINSADGVSIGRVLVRFASPFQYYIHLCTGNGWTDLPVQPPEEVDKIWTFQKTASILSTRKPIGVLQQSPIPHLSSSPIRDNIPAPYIINKPGFI